MPEGSEELKDKNPDQKGQEEGKESDVIEKDITEEEVKEALEKTEKEWKEMEEKAKKAEELLKQKEAEVEKEKEEGKEKKWSEEAQKEIHALREEAKANRLKAKAIKEENEKVFKALLDSELEGIPEKFRDIIPDGMSVAQQLLWVKKAKNKGLFNAPEQVGKETPAGKTPQITKEKWLSMNASERKELMDKHPDEFQKALKQYGLQTLTRR